MIGGWRRLAGATAFGLRSRVDSYATIGDLLDNGMELERALSIVIAIARSQGESVRAWILERWRAALLRGQLAQEVTAWLPPSEAMVFQASDRVSALHLFRGAERVATLRGRQLAAVSQALAMPTILFGGVIAALWGAGGHFVPVLETVVPAERWSPGAQLFRALSVWLYANLALFLALFAVVVGLVWVSVVAWTGPGRAGLDRLPPWSLYRMLTGSAFVFVMLEYARAGLDLNAHAFGLLARGGSPYARSRIGAIERRLRAGAGGLGAAMMQTRHGFPDPSLVPIVAALDGSADWEHRLGAYIDRWVGRSEALLRQRAAMLNGLLLVVVAVAMAGGISVLFGLLTVAGV